MKKNSFRPNPLWVFVPLFLLVLCSGLGKPLLGDEPPPPPESVLDEIAGFGKSFRQLSEEGLDELAREAMRATNDGDIAKLDDILEELDRGANATDLARERGEISDREAAEVKGHIRDLAQGIREHKDFLEANPLGRLVAEVWRIRETIKLLAENCDANEIDKRIKELQDIRGALEYGEGLGQLALLVSRISELKRWARGLARGCRDKRVGLLGDPKNIIGKIGESANVSYCEENPCREKQGVPNDPYFSSKGSWGQSYDDQWAIKHVGFTADKDSAWNIEDGVKNPVIIAVIDSGLDWNHQDVSWDNIWRNPKEIPDNGKDDDNNGYVDDAIGWNFMGNNNKPWDEDGHGTFVTGVIAAATNNGVGIAGINHGAKVMVLKALNTFGHSRASFLSEALFYAANNGARVINISVGGKHLTRTEQEAIDYAHSKGAVIVVASGNEAVDTIDYSPAGLKNVIAVSTTDEKDKRAGFSNWGQGIALAAPGMDVLSLRARRTDLMLGIPGIKYSPRLAYVGKDTRYYRASGSSFSAPIVSATASLIFAKNPKLTNTQVERMLLQSARDVEVPGWDQYTGFGLLDARAALQADPEYYLLAQIQRVQPVQEKGAVYLEVVGSVEGSDFSGAAIDVGLGERPEKWEGVVKVSQSVKGGRLGLVPATKLNKVGKWTVRLQSMDKKGKLRESRASVDIE